jgi:hypothetical protein
MGNLNVWKRALRVVAAAALFSGAAASSGCATLGKFSLEVRSPESGDASTKLVVNGGALRSGDRYALSLSVKEPLYLYVEQRTDEGIAQLLPRPGAPLSLSQPGAAIAVPPGGFLRMGARPGAAVLYVVASSQSISVEQARFEIEKFVSAGDQGGESEATVSASLDERGIGVLRFKLQHR